MNAGAVDVEDEYPWWPMGSVFDRRGTFASAHLPDGAERYLRAFPPRSDVGADPTTGGVDVGADRDLRAAALRRVLAPR